MSTRREAERRIFKKLTHQIPFAILAHLHQVASVDISPFINNLPSNRDTHSFSTSDASGSTSCAASFIEVREMCRAGNISGPFVDSRTLFNPCAILARR